MNESDLPDWAKDLTKLAISFQPLEDRVIIVPDPVRDVSEGGVVYAVTTRGHFELTGQCIAVGPGKWSEFSNARMPMEIEVGKKYNYPKHVGDDMVLNENGRLVMYTGRIPKNHLLVKVVRQNALLACINN